MRIAVISALIVVVLVAVLGASRWLAKAPRAIPATNVEEPMPVVTTRSPAIRETAALRNVAEISIPPDAETSEHSAEPDPSQGREEAVGGGGGEMGGDGTFIEIDVDAASNIQLRAAFYDGDSQLVTSRGGAY